MHNGDRGHVGRGVRRRTQLSLPVGRSKCENAFLDSDNLPPVAAMVYEDEDAWERRDHAKGHHDGKQGAENEHGTGLLLERILC